jgi:hypothetical protein
MGIVDSTAEPNPWLFMLGKWDLREPGAAAYRDTRFLVDGAERKLLCRLVRARGTALTYAVLKDEALDNPHLENATLRAVACRLRRLLKEHLRGIPDNPLPCVDRMAYRLDVPR